MGWTGVKSTQIIILGRYLSKEELDRRKRFALYIAGLLAIAVSVGIDGVLDLCPFLYSLPAIVWIPLVTLATFCVSAFLIWPISRIPVLGKYIV